jgi:Glyoxalase-like domain
MACRISELVIDAADPGRLAAFWSQVLGYVELGREDDGSIEIGPPEFTSTGRAERRMDRIPPIHGTGNPRRLQEISHQS